ncbi:MAG: PTS cellobiose transporter subunit IIC [Clostridium sp.]|nr:MULTISPECIES: PTS cellobiose transporter subunit IIC [Clostridium]MDB2085189.1 PTS cellobiose transporter subunit IIC [Clostridium paraputrificum]MDB2107319.1 PTS cellobiose transporter subunit IIC [Clostridium paraputrificum]MDB2113876.1 PTS cellobiose transporter subunit IIC [Clostridium paraputrificum]MDB2121672.1 PTS cellobiose transporter subunit IIC [Clostridium paraputrificum]MDU2285022.1 PTS cellobiose transporter subunit IIC [Clostridium sp.]
MLDKLESIFMPLAEKIGKNKYLISIRDGFLLTTPLLIIGSFFLLIANFPINNWTEFWARFFGENWTAYMAKPTSATFDIMAILAVVGIAYSFSRELNVDKLSGAAVAVVSWFILMPYKVTDGSVTLNGIPLDWVGSKGIFIGIITAFVSVHIYAWVIKKGWIIKMPKGVPPAVTQSFAALVPSAVVLGVFFLVNSLLALTPYDNAFNFIFKFLQQPLLVLGNTLGAVLVAMGFQHFFWFFGINGGSIVGSIMQPILTPLSMENLSAFQAGNPLPNVINQQFYDLFTTFGGAGSTLSMLIAMIIVCRSQRIKNLSKISVVPALFGINEPVIFGLPVVLNPTILIPFLLTPLINILISYFSMVSGLVPFTSGVSMPWTTPVIISGFLTTGWRGALLQLILVILGVFIYMPFVKMMDKQYKKEELQAIESSDDDVSLDDLSFDDL